MFIRFVSVLCFGLLMCVSAAWAEDSDKDWLTRELQSLLSDTGRKVEITGFQGALSSQATIDELTISDTTGVWLTLQGVKLDWTRTELLSGNLNIQELSAQRIDLQRLPKAEASSLPQAEASSFKLPELPVNINIAKISAVKVDLGPTIIGEPVSLTAEASAQLNEAGLKAKLFAKRLDGLEGRFDVDVKLARAENRLSIKTTIKEEANGIAANLLGVPDKPSIQLDLKGDGPLDDFAADFILASNGQKRLEGQVALNRLQDSPSDSAIDADLRGDITTLVLPQYRDFFGTETEAKLNAKLLASGAFDIKSFTLSTKQASLVGKAYVGADQWPQTFALTGRVERADGSPVLLPGGDGTRATGIALDVSFDAEKSDRYQASFEIDDLVGQGFSINQLGLTSGGTIDLKPDGGGALHGDVKFTANGVLLDDPAMNDALGSSLSGRATMAYQRGKPFQIADLQLGGADYAAQGKIEFASNLRASFDLYLRALDLSRFAKLADQKLAGQAQLKIVGLAEPLTGAFDLKVDGEARGIKTDTDELDRLFAGATKLSTHALRDQTGTRLSDVVLSNDALKFEGEAILATGKSTIEGNAELLDTSLILQNVQGLAAVTGRAQQQDGQWQVEARASGPHELRAALAGVATGPDMDVGFDLSLPRVAPYAPGLPGGLTANGRAFRSAGELRVSALAKGPYDLRATIDGTPEDFKFRTFFPDLRTVVPDISGDLTVAGTAKKRAEGIAINAEATGLSGTRASINGTVLTNGDLKMQARGTAPLGLTGPFIQPRRLRGQAAFDLAINGAPRLASLSGTINTSGASLTAPNARLGFDDLTADIRLANARADLIARANVLSGGQLSAEGAVGLTGALPADISLMLDRLVLTDPDLYRTVISGGVKLLGPVSGGATISGDLTLDETNIQVPTSGVNSIADIPPIKHIGAPKTVQQTLQRAGLTQKQASSGQTAADFGLALTIDAPRQIFVRGRGLDAELGGQLRLTGSTKRPISAGGFELLRGRLDILGKRFDLDDGSIQFQGDLIPYIRFVATTPTSAGQVSVQVEGQADAPKVTFESTPAGPEDEAISQLLFGRSITDISAFQALQLANAVAVLAGRSSGGLINNLRGKFGLDDLDLSTTEDGKTAVKVGKYLSDKVYTDVTASSDGSGEVSLNLDLTGDLKAKARVDNRGKSGLGLFFEKDY